MKFLLVTVFLVLTISTVIQCFNPFVCNEKSDCPSAHQYCLNGHCHWTRYPVVLGSISQDNGDEERYPHNSDIRIFRTCDSTRDCPGPLNVCIGGYCTY